MLSYKRIYLYNLKEQIIINRILLACGKNMAINEGLHHWDNNNIKNFLIVLFCMLKNKVYLVMLDKEPVATFQINIIDNILYFEKLACLPDKTGNGIGTWCLESIEDLAKDNYCDRVTMDVYSSSKKAIKFYKKRGYKQYNVNKTLKYTQIRMEKNLY